MYSNKFQNKIYIFYYLFHNQSVDFTSHVFNGAIQHKIQQRVEAF